MAPSINTLSQNFKARIKMKTISLLLAVIVAIIMEKAMAEYLLVEIDGEDKKGMIHLVYAKLNGRFILSI